MKSCCFVTTWINPKGLMLSEVSQRDKYCLNPLFF